MKVFVNKEYIGEAIGSLDIALDPKDEQVARRSPLTLGTLKEELDNIASLDIAMERLIVLVHNEENPALREIASEAKRHVATVLKQLKDRNVAWE